MAKLRLWRDADQQDEDQQDEDQQDGDKQAHDAPLARDSTWFVQQLGEEWQAEEPGIYRYVGPSASS